MNDLTADISRILRQGNIANFTQESRWIAEDAPDRETALLWASRRAAGEPLQYILGTAPFREVMLKVDPRVLIPRPETELLAQWLIDHAPDKGCVLDLGCGSGAIAIATAYERSDLQVTAADISTDALALAEENAALCGVKNVTFVNSDLFSALAGCRYDLIGANLPYVTNEEYPFLPAEVRDFEPRLALTAPDRGLALILQTVKELPEHLNHGGGAIFELAPEQAAETAAAMSAIGMTSTVIRDFCGKERFVAGVFNV
ncbi:MAG: peptide chain release factor N(5)-glutamine methyltransferase [Lentisphaerae bacterium]|nr:peptide chain release factor N(5)-glutamine methyltransferase [Lentisphaerota bacterium]